MLVLLLFARAHFALIEILRVHVKCSKEEPNNARNEERENWSVEMPMRSLKKVIVAGNPMVPESWYVDE